MTQPLGVVHILIARKTAEHRLSQQADQRMPTVLAARRVGKHLACQHGQSERVIKFSTGQQPSVGGKQRKAAVKIEPQGVDSDSPAGLGNPRSKIS